MGIGLYAPVKEATGPTRRLERFEDVLIHVPVKEATVGRFAMGKMYWPFRSTPP
jgi:hypothetical protein